MLGHSTLSHATLSALAAASMSGLVSNVHAAAGWVLAAKKGWQARFRAAHDHLSVMRLELLCMSRIVRAMRVVLAGARTVIMATRRPQTRQTCGKLPAPAVRRKRKAAAGNDEGTQAAPTAAPPRKAKKKAASVLLPSPRPPRSLAGLTLWDIAARK